MRGPITIAILFQVGCVQVLGIVDPEVVTSIPDGDVPDVIDAARDADVPEPDACTSCPACANGTDDDSDGASDFPVDFGCIADGATEVFCAADVDFGGVIAIPATPGTMADPKIDNFEQSCQANTGNDVSFALALPVPVATLVIDTDTLGTTVDTVVSLKDANCGVELGCDDDGGTGTTASLTVLDVPAGNYAINVDSFGTTNNDAFTLNVKGTVAVGTVCTSSLFTSGVLVCPTGTTCTGGSCR